MKQSKTTMEKASTIHESDSNIFLAMPLTTYVEQHRGPIFPRRDNFYHLVLFTDGTGSFTVDFDTFRIEPYLTYFTVPGQVHTWSFDSLPRGYIVNFGADLLDSLLSERNYLQRFGFSTGIAVDQVIRVGHTAGKRIENLLREMVDATNDSNGRPMDYIRILLLHALFVLDAQGSRAMHDPGSTVGERQSRTRNKVLIRHFRELVEQHYRTERFPKFYADQLQVSSNHLNIVCKTYLGKQAGSFIRDRILLEAKRMLTHPDMIIADLADELHFSDNSYFTKFFKKMEGITPEEFRQKIAQQSQNHRFNPG